MINKNPTKLVALVAGAAVALALLVGAFQVPLASAALQILTGPQGGTGIGTTTAGSIGNCLSVSSVNPLIYTFSGCAGGSGAAYPFTPGTFGATKTSATSTAINDSAGLMASSTSWLTSLQTIAYNSTFGTTTYASTTAITSTSIYGTGLVSGNCVQASTNGLLTTSAAACGSGSGSGYPFTPTIFDANSYKTSATTTSLETLNAGIVISTSSNPIINLGGTATGQFGDWALMITNPQSVNGMSTGIGFSVTAVPGAVTGGGIGFIRQGASSFGDLFFATAPSAGQNTERLRITSDGRLGLGSTTPFAKFAIQANFNDQGVGTSTTLFAIASSTSANATSTLFTVDNTGKLVDNNTSTSTFAAGLQTTYLNLTGASTATSTSANGLDLSGGCFSIAGTCLQTLIGSASAYKQAVKYASTSTLPANTYSNGSGGVGATITGNGNGPLFIDGNTTALGDRILVKNEATGANNGIYTITTLGIVAVSPFVLTRATDYNSSLDVFPGVANFVNSGTTNANTCWILTNTTAVTIGTTALTYDDACGAGSFSGTAPISVSGTTISLNIGAGLATIGNNLTNLIGFDFTPATNYGVNTNSTTTPVWFKGATGGLIGLAASSTSYFDQILVGSSTVSTMATSTVFGNLVIGGTASSSQHILSGVPNCSGASALTTNASGFIACGAITASGGAFPFTPTTNYAVNTSATTTPLFAKGAVGGVYSFMASNTAAFDQIKVGSSTSGSLALSTFFGNGEFYGTASSSRFLAQGNNNAAAPAFSFTGDTNTGIDSSGADILTVVTGGATKLSIGSAIQPATNVSVDSGFGNSYQLRTVNGADCASSLTYTFSGVTNTGICQYAAGVVGVSGNAVLTAIFGNASTTLIGNATTTGTFFATTASSTNLFGANLATCNGSSFLQWSAGLFSCGTPSAGGGAFPFTPLTNFGVNTSATTTAIWDQKGLFASTTSQFDSAYMASSTGPQIGLLDTLGSAIWTIRNIAGNLLFATSSATSPYATTTGPLPLQLSSGGNLSECETDLFAKQGTSTNMVIDWANTCNQVLVRVGTSAFTIGFNNASTTGMTKRIVIANPNATAGAVTWAQQGNFIRWAGGTAPTQQTAANKMDLYSFSVTQGTSTSAAASTNVIMANQNNF